MVNAAQIYQGNQVSTASPAKLTLMLYEGAIKFCNLAMIGIEENDVQKAHTNIMKAPELLEEALTHLRDMRDIWKEIMKANKTM